MPEFDGFPRNTLTFLRGLSRNNDKTWFDAHRADYARYYLEPAKSFVAAAGEALRRLQPGLTAEPRVNGSIFRINRDMRFTSDKRPYKDYLDIWFWEGERQTAVSGFYFRLTPKSLGLGAGAHRFDRDRLGRYRDAVVDATAGPGLKRAVGAVQKTGWHVEGEHFKRTPSGYEATGEAERLLRFNALWTGQDEGIPDVLYGPELVDYCRERWRRSLPLHRWLVRSLG